MESQGGARVDEELAALAAEFPGFHFWRGVGGVLYVRRPMSSPPWVRRAATIAELRAEVQARGA